MGEQEAAALRYTAFLSYSHKDAAAAQRLHRRLETYRLPRRLVGSMAAWGPVPSRLWPIFRDREELPAATDLSETVRQALAQSGSLVVLCSPHAAKSLWVAEEIATFRRLHPDRPVLAAILEGDPPNCFPGLLRSVGPDGASHEPLATDLRPEADGGRLGLLKLVAGITGIGLDELVQRDASRRVRRVTAVTVGALFALLIMTALTIFALNARSEAEHQRAEAEGLIEFMLTDLRRKLVGVGRVEIMIDVNRRALSYYGGQEALGGLSQASLEHRARILHAIGEDEKERGRLENASRAFREAHRITSEQLARDSTDPEKIFYHAQSEYWLGSIDHLTGNYTRALASFVRYRWHANHMVRLSPSNIRYLGELAYAESNLGIVRYSGFQRHAEARAHFQSSLRWFERASQLQPENKTWRVEIADAHAWIADTWYGEGRLHESREERLIEEQMKRQLLREEPANRAFLYALVISSRSLARIDIDLGEFERALPRLEEARSAMSRLLALDPDNLTWRDQATRIETNRALLFIESGRRTEAREAIRAARLLLDGTVLRGDATTAGRNSLERQVDQLSRRLRGLPPSAAVHRISAGAA